MRNYFLIHFQKLTTELKIAALTKSNKLTRCILWLRETEGKLKHFSGSEIIQIKASEGTSS